MPMLKLFKEVLRVGNATVPYPFVKVDVSPGFRGKPEYDPDTVHCLRGMRGRMPAECIEHGDGSRIGHAHLVHFLWTLHLLRAL